MPEHESKEKLVKKHKQNKEWMWVIVIVFLAIIGQGCIRRMLKNNHHISKTEYNANELSVSKCDEILQNTVIHENLYLPRKIDDNITYQSVNLTKESLVYYTVVDDFYWELTRDEELSKAHQIEMLHKRYSEMKTIIEMLIKTRRGLSYIYILRDTKKIERIDITYNDLITTHWP